MHLRDLIECKLLLKIVKGHFGRKRVADAVDHSQLRAVLLGRNREPSYTGMGVQVRRVSSDLDVPRRRTDSLQVRGVIESHTRTDQAFTYPRLLTVRNLKLSSVSRTCSMQWSLLTPLCSFIRNTTAV